MVLPILRWFFWLGFLAYCLYVNAFRENLVNQFGLCLVIFGLANAAVFVGLWEFLIRERAKIPRPTFGRLMPTSSSNSTG